MKYALTGHTGLIGTYLYKNLPNCIGFTRKTGFDIRKKIDQDRIVQKSLNCDVFINCAHAGPGASQTDLLWKIYEQWQNDNKYIINIGTDKASPNLWSQVRQDYPLEKSILAATVDHIQKQKTSKCKVSIINPNVVFDNTLIDIKNAIKFIVESKTQINSINLQ